MPLRSRRRLLLLPTEADDVVELSAEGTHPEALCLVIEASEQKRAKGGKNAKGGAARCVRAALRLLSIDDEEEVGPEEGMGYEVRFPRARSLARAARRKAAAAASRAAAAPSKATRLLPRHAPRQASAYLRSELLAATVREVASLEADKSKKELTRQLELRLSAAGLAVAVSGDMAAGVVLLRLAPARRPPHAAQRTRCPSTRRRRRRRKTLQNPAKPC
jgi:hypothetical protein